MYAVVDLETTGTNPTTDRIIQFGCVFIKDNQIISTYATDVNPKCKIPKHIEKLTGVSTLQVANAPYFEDVAPEIAEMLKDCVFVAHNIYFDYHFLSQELSRCGEEELTIQGIDTVELAQLFLPTEPSYRLGDLAEAYGFTHDRPHQADSDAEVTAELLLLIEEKIKTLPIVTLSSIVKLAGPLGMNTKDYIELVLEEMLKDVPPLQEGIQLIGGLALRKKEVPTLSGKTASVYPESKAKKVKLYADKFDYRTAQSKMMNMVYRFFTTPYQTEPIEKVDRFAGKNLALEASTGSGKSFGYLLPLSYLATKDEPVIISTVSTVLQTQLVTQSIAEVNRLRPGSLLGTLVKSHRHFIDLERFSASLASPVPQKQYAIYQMRLLVWLTETETGDFDELNLTNLNHALFRHVRHQGVGYLSETSDFYDVDFWRHLQKKVAQSNVIVVNHAFLCEENRRETPLLPESKYLIIDEAHHLPEIAQQTLARQINSYQFSKMLAGLFYEDERLAQLKLLWEQTTWQSWLRPLKTCVTELSDLFEDLKEDVIEGILIDGGGQQDQEWLVTNTSLERLPIYTNKNLEHLLLLLNDAVVLSEKMDEAYQAEIDKFTISDRVLMMQWLSDLNELKSYRDFFVQFTETDRDGLLRWIMINSKNQQLTAFYSDIEASSVTSATWYQRYEKILYTGGTIRAGKDTQFLGRSLGLDYLPFKSVPSAYDYSKQGRIYVPTESVNQQVVSSAETVQFICETLERLMVEQKRSVLVLFSAHHQLQTVYHRLNKTLGEGQGIEVLGQGISGSREKIIKRFEHANQALLLGAASFWEGIDLPGESLEVIVVTKLPFDSPDRPYVKAKYESLANQGVDSFYKYALPKACIRLRQGFGRLIRSETDKGIMIMLDPRFVKAKYSSTLIKALPQDLPIIENNVTEILKDMKEFL
ncbi:hypothetical protein CBF31_02870 [Vagococcus fessus]|uniref:3'-5' exonuclease DinG n=2 Tax=Vagococcus fessus TaxID=120370 RepID=A0A430ADK5_9ENTE|nr:hypothetical protein CBF31_02870 [Vagococcus fessus]